MKVYERKSAGRTGEGIEPTTTIVSRREGLDEVNGCMLGTSHNKVLRMSSMGGGNYHIVYRNGEVVTLTLVDEPAEQTITTDKLQPGDEVEHRRNGDRFTVDTVTTSTRDWRFHRPGDKTSETGMDIVGHNADGERVDYLAAQSCPWWVIKLAARS